MREFQMPSFKAVAFGGSAWLVGLALLMILPFSSTISVGDLIGREVIGGILLASSIYLLRLGLTFSESEESSRAVVREAIRRVGQGRKAA